MTPTTPTGEQLRDFLAWRMSNEVPPDAKYRDEPGGKEDQCRAAFLEGWECGEGNAIVKTTAPLVKAIAAIVEKEPPDDWEPYPSAGEYRMPDGSGIDDSNSGDVHTHGVELGAWSVAKQIRAALKAAEKATG